MSALTCEGWLNGGIVGMVASRYCRYSAVKDSALDLEVEVG